ncbi:MAG: ABC transporter ATP-binding protein/permease [Lachnospiraceae bacterium]|nr:ABC transporter ATP-binding protein/permease [Lachnospiraceae bacterium]
MIKTRLIRLLSQSKKYIIYQVLWQWLALLSQIVAIFQVSRLLQQAADGTFEVQSLFHAAGIFTGVMAVRFICERMAAKATYMASVDVKHVLREKIYDKMLRLGASYKEQVSTSEVVQVCSEGVEQLETYFGRYLPQLFYSLLAPVTLFGVLSFVSFKASLVLLFCVPLIPVSIVLVQKIAKKLLSKYWSIYTGLGDSFLENLQGLTTLKIYQADEKKAAEMDEESERFRKITMKVLTMQLNSTSVMDIMAYGGAAVGMIVVLGEFAAGKVLFSGALIVILLASEFFIPLRLLGSFFHIAMNGMAASDNIFRILDLPEPEQGTEMLSGDGLSIHLQDVHFGYDEEREVLKGITLDIPVGSFVSLVGESGSGKSTIAGLLSGKNRAFNGNIRIGETYLQNISEKSLMEQVTVIRHNSYLFKGTVAENLRMAKEDATDEEMIAVLKKVNLWDFMTMQKGLETELLEKASNLSGGQCQRLALARGLLHNSKIYIFDEATSNIDIESEELIMSVIHELARTKSVLLISHRLSNVVKSDCIYMLKDGVIAEQGHHELLMAQKGPYQKLFDYQNQLEQYGKVAGA